MKSKTIASHSSGNGFIDAGQETEQTAASLGLTNEETMNLCLITEEMLSMLRSVVGELNAEFWLEGDGKAITLHLSARQKLGNEQRDELIKSTSSGTNDATQGFLGKLCEMFVRAMSVGKDIDRYYSSESYQAADITDAVIATPKWDRFERSVLLAIADNVSISIRGGIVDLTVSKQFL